MDHDPEVEPGGSRIGRSASKVQLPEVRLGCDYLTLSNSPVNALKDQLQAELDLAAWLAGTSDGAELARAE